MDEEPLIYTTIGNVPIKDLQYKHYWLESEEATTFVEEYYKDEILVKRNSHSRLKQGIAAGLFGG